MKNRWIPLLMLAVLLATAPAAMAGHCFRCGWDPSTCASITVGEGRTQCEPGMGDEPCLLTGMVCFGGHAAAPPPLAQEFEIVLVEQLDESRPAPAQPRVAALESPRTTMER